MRTTALLLALSLPLTVTLAVTAAPETHGARRSLPLCMTTAVPAAAGAMSTAIVGRLPNRELRHRTRRNRLPLGARQGGSDQRASHRSFL